MQGKSNQATAFRVTVEGFMKDMKKQEEERLVQEQAKIANHSKCAVCRINWKCNETCKECDLGDGHCCPAEFTCIKYN